MVPAMYLPVCMHSIQRWYQFPTSCVCWFYPPPHPARRDAAREGPIDRPCRPARVVRGSAGAAGRYAPATQEGAGAHRRAAPAAPIALSSCPGPRQFPAPVTAAHPLQSDWLAGTAAGPTVCADTPIVRRRGCWCSSGFSSAPPGVVEELADVFYPLLGLKADRPRRWWANGFSEYFCDPGVGSILSVVTVSLLP
jgi:hypothetical protein